MYRFCESPNRLTDALKLKAEHGAAARFIAGGTDLLIDLTRDSAADSANVGLIDLTRIAGLADIWEEDGALHLGPLVTHNQCVRSRLIVEQAFPLARACWEVGAPADSEPGDDRRQPGHGQPGQRHDCAAAGAGCQCARREFGAGRSYAAAGALLPRRAAGGPG